MHDAEGCSAPQLAGPLRPNYSRFFGVDLHMSNRTNPEVLVLCGALVVGAGGACMMQSEVVMLDSLSCDKA